MPSSWIVLLPTIAVAITACITKKLNGSLLVGIFLAALIAVDFSWAQSASLLISRFYSQATDLDNLFLYGFLLILGIVITLLEHTGAAQAFAHRLVKRITNAREAQLASLVLSGSLFIDDYLSCLTTGYVMRPITDKYLLPRAKLAYLIHSFSGPLVILAPLSSWVALITSQIEKAGVSSHGIPSTKIIADPFYLYCASIPYIFYSILLIFSVLFIVIGQIQYGPMATQETIALKTHNLFGGKPPLVNPSENKLSARVSMWDLILPVGVLILSFLIGILWSGNYYVLGGTNSFIDSLKSSSGISLILFAASMATLAVTLGTSLYKKSCTLLALPTLIKSGCLMMSSSVIMVFLASTLGIMMREDLHAGTYLAQLLAGTLSLFWLPLLLYTISIGISIMTGSAWGTIALLVPLSIQIITTLAAIPLPATSDSLVALLPALGAVFSGAVCGNHISPIAETTIMSSTSAGCYPLDHAYTQLWYAMPAVIATGICYALCGLFFGNPLAMLVTSLAVGIASCFLIILLANKFWN